jgi:hypothetical protein
MATLSATLHWGREHLLLYTIVIAPLNGGIIIQFLNFV